MKLNDLYNKIAPHIISLTALKKENEQYYLMGNGTGFLTGDGYLITNFHVMEKVLIGISKGEDYILQIGQSERKKVTLPITTGVIECSDGSMKYETENRDFTFGVYEFNSTRIKEWITSYSSDEESNDYIILNPEIKISYSNPNQTREIELGGQKIPFCFPSNNEDCKILDFSQEDKVYIGQKVCIFGYPFGKENLSMNQGIISSIYEKCGVKIFQIDGIVNNGNSGGPLIDVATGKVIGIVSRKEDGLNELFKELKKNIVQNHKILKEAIDGGCSIAIGNVDLAKAQFVAFDDTLKIIDHIERSANVGIGYAFSVNKIMEDLKSLREEHENTK